MSLLSTYICSTLQLKLYESEPPLSALSPPSSALPLQALPSPHPPPDSIPSWQHSFDKLEEKINSRIQHNFNLEIPDEQITEKSHYN
jgi:hypothetical protein